MTGDVEGIVGYLHETGHLKRTKRAGWWIAGVRDPESVAEHSFRTGIIAYVLALMEGANPDRAASLALFHDVLETRIGDIPSTGRAHLGIASPEEITKVQTVDLPSPIAGTIRDLVSEYEAKESPESRCAKDADKLECLLQAREYETQGYSLVQPWVDTMLSSVKTASARELAQAALSTPVDSWWHEIVSSYGSVKSEPPTTANDR
jgi:putative hydrolases of HD superfamily